LIKRIKRNGNLIELKVSKTVYQRCGGENKLKCYQESSISSPYEYCLGFWMFDKWEEIDALNVAPHWFDSSQVDCALDHFFQIFNIHPSHQH